MKAREALGTLATVQALVLAKMLEGNKQNKCACRVFWMYQAFAFVFGAFLVAVLFSAYCRHRRRLEANFIPVNIAQ